VTRYIKALSLALVAVFAMGALAAASASANDVEFHEKNGNTAGKVKFTTSGGPNVLKAGGNEITCQKSASEGNIEPPSNVKTSSVTFTECESVNAKGEKCKANSIKPKGAAGEVKTVELKGNLGESVTQAAGTIVEDLAPAKGTEFTEIEKSKCIPSTKVKGNVIGAVGEPGTLKAVGSLNFAELNKEQEFTEYEENGSEGKKVPSTLNAFGVKAIFISKQSIKFAEEILVTNS